MLADVQDGSTDLGTNLARLTCVGANHVGIAAVIGKLKAGGMKGVLPLQVGPPQGSDRLRPVQHGFR